MELIVTLLRTVARAVAARKAVRPARAPEETSRPAIDARTEEEVILMIRPNRRSIMPGITACASAIGVSILASSPRKISSRLIASKGCGGGPPLLFSGMAGAGQGAGHRARATG